MTPTENLKSEHNDILELLKIMSKIAESIKSNDVFYPNDVEEIIDFLKHFIEKSHHGKEEVFYTELISTGVPKENESLSIMKYEHVLIRNYLKDINSCVENCKIGNSFSGVFLADSLTNYVVLMTNHIKKEEEIIYPLAESELSKAKLIDISKEFERIEEKIIHHGFHDHYHKLVEKLQSKYSD